MILPQYSLTIAIPLLCRPARHLHALKEMFLQCERGSKMDPCCIACILKIEIYGLLMAAERQIGRLPSMALPTACHLARLAP